MVDPADLINTGGTCLWSIRTTGMTAVGKGGGRVVFSGIFSLPFTTNINE